MKTWKRLVMTAALIGTGLLSTGCASILLSEYIEDGARTRCSMKSIERAYLKKDTLVMDVKRGMRFLGEIPVGETRVMPLKNPVKTGERAWVTETRWFAHAGRKAQILPLHRRDVSYEELKQTESIARSVMLENAPPLLVWGMVGESGHRNSLWGALVTEENGNNQITPLDLPPPRPYAVHNVLQKCAPVLYPVTVVWDVVTLPVQLLAVYILKPFDNLKYN